MGRSWMLRVVLGVVAMVVIGALVIVAITREGDSGEPEEVASASPTATATARATVVTPAGTAEASATEPAPAITATPRAEYTPTPRETPVVSTPPPTPVPATTPALGQRPPPNATPTSTPEPEPRIILVTPVGTATPYPTPTPAPTPEPTADPNVTPTPVTTPPNRVDGNIDPPPSGECLYCWMYSGRHPTPDDADYIATEDFLREHYDARSERVDNCGTCPMVFSRHSTGADLARLQPTEITDSGGKEWLVLSLRPNAMEQFVALVGQRRNEALANGWIVPITETHHIRDVAGMIAYPTPPVPHDAWALTPDGFDAISPLREDPAVPVEEPPLTVPYHDCAFCWRYLETIAYRTYDRTTERLAERFPNADGPTCDTCPWMYDNSDLASAIDDGWLAELTVGRPAYISLGHPAPRLLDAALLGLHRSAGFLTRIGYGYSERQVALMLAYPGDPTPQYFMPYTWVVTNRGMRAMQQAAANPPVPYTPILWGNPHPAKADLPLEFCVADLGDADGTAHLIAITGEAISRWNLAVDVTALSLTGTCAADISVASGNSRNEVSVFPGVDEHADGWAPYTGNDSDVTISSRALGVPGRNEYVLIHEFGHVLGFDHSDDPRSVMYGQSRITGQSANVTIQDWEVAQLREFWGFD